MSLRAGQSTECLPHDSRRATGESYFCRPRIGAGRSAPTQGLPAGRAVEAAAVPSKDFNSRSASEPPSSRPTEERRGSRLATQRWGRCLGECGLSQRRMALASRCADRNRGDRVGDCELPAISCRNLWLSEASNPRCRFPPEPPGSKTSQGWRPRRDPAGAVSF
jgi:hypothetical protein